MILSSGGGLPCIHPSVTGSLAAASANWPVCANAAEFVRTSANAILAFISCHTMTTFEPGLRYTCVAGGRYTFWETKRVYSPSLTLASDSGR
jgi:hypothetical protein